MPELDTTYYMAAINLRSKRVLVVGAGAIGLEKTEGLLACGAAVTVVAPDACDGIAELAGSGAIEWHRRTYEPSDLDGCFIVIAATSTRDVNVRVFEDAEARSMLVNVVDVPELCNFIVPAIVRVGPIAIAISTSGASPALAKRMKRQIGELFGEEYGDVAVLLNEVRDWARSVLPTYEERREFFEGIVNGDPDPIVVLRERGRDAVRDLIRRAQEATSSTAAGR